MVLKTDLLLINSESVVGLGDFHWRGFLQESKKFQGIFKLGELGGNFRKIFPRGG